MRVLLVAAAVCLFGLVHGSAIGSVKNGQDTRELVQMLEKMLKKVSAEKKQVLSGDGADGGSGDDRPDPFEALDNYLHENEADILGTPLYQVPEDRMENLLKNIDGILSSYVEPEMGSVVALRFIVGFFEHAIYEGTEKIWEIAGAISSKIEEFKDMNELTLDKRQRVTRSLDAKKERAREMSLKALSAKKEMLSKKMFEEQAPKIDLRDDDDDDVTEISGYSGFSGYEYCQFSAVWEHIAGPAYEAAWGLRSIISEYDYYYWGNIFYELQYLAEDEGILQASVHDAVYAFAYQFGDILYSPPAALPSDEVWTRIVPVMMEIVEAMENFDGTDLPEIDALSEEKKAIFAQIYLAVGPLIQESAKPMRHLLDSVLSGDGEAVGTAIQDYTGRVFARQLYILANLANIIREQLPHKADALAVIEEALKNGKQEDILVAIFTKVAEAGMSMGERIENMIYFFGHILDHVAMVVGPDGVRPEGPTNGRGSGSSGSGSGGRIGDRKRFLKMINKV